MHMHIDVDIDKLTQADLFAWCDDTDVCFPLSSDLSQLQQQFHQLNEPALQQLSSSHHTLHSLLTSPQSPLVTTLQHEIRAAVQRSVETVANTVPCGCLVP